jgi:hypothetical protein
MSHRPVQRVGLPIHIDPHVGKLRCQVKLLHEAISPRIVLSIVHLNAKNVWEPEIIPGR